MGRRRRPGVSEGLPDCVYPQIKRGITYYRFKHPLTGRFHGLGRDRAYAIRVGRQAYTAIMDGRAPEARTLERILRGGAPPIESVVQAYKAFRATRRLAPRTRSEEALRLDSAAEAWRGRPVDTITRRDVVEHLEPYPDRSADVRRTTLRQLFEYAISEGYRDDNPVAHTWARDAEVGRQRLVMDEFKAIRAAAEPWLANAMDLSLVTLQARAEVASMRFDDEREAGYLFVDRRKVARYESGHIRIAIGPECRAVIARCRDDLASPFLVHRRPQRRRRREIALEHWTQVPEERITKAFSAVRDHLGVRADLPRAVQRPSFHEIRALGADRYREQGVDEAAIQRLLGHTSERMTRKYLDRRGREVRYTEAETG